MTDTHMVGMRSDPHIGICHIADLRETLGVGPLAHLSYSRNNYFH